MRKAIFLLLLAVPFAALSQNPATVFTIPNDTVRLACGVSCASISVSVPHLKQSTDYVVVDVPYLPFEYTTPTGNQEMILYDDDQWSNSIPFPFAFTFCFYGVTYSSVVMGSNSALTFDLTNANTASDYEIDAAIPSSFYQNAMIFGPYHDVDPSLTTSPNMKIEWRVEGTAPARRWIASYFEVPMFGTACPNIFATHQMVLYENTGIVEVYIKDKPFCTGWNEGLAILGMQDQTGSKAVAAPGKNATTWGDNGFDSAYRFIPSGGAARFRKAELILNNQVIATNTTDTASGSLGMLDINFANVCPTTDSTAYAIRVYYGSCTNPALEMSFTDTVYIIKSALTATATSTNASCQQGGSITVTSTGGAGSVEYSINGGTSYQSSGTFNNLQAGTYTVMVRDGGTCPVTLQPITITLVGAVSVEAGPNVTICAGQSVTREATGNATSYTWSPSNYVADVNASQTTFSPLSTTTYTVTAATGNCVATDAFTITVAPGATINAGPDASILSGQTYTMQASGSAGTYEWSPNTGFNTTSILNPTVTPQSTTTYTLTVTTSAGCTASDEVTITVVPYCIKPMEAFTPNGDGVNDVWLVTNGSCLRTAKAQVFNRNGAKVFESNDYKNNWTGTHNGKPLPDGTYYFVVTYQLLTGKTEYLKGNVTILR